MEKIKTLLIANRGEIAVRIIRTAKTLKLKTVAVYTKSDAASHHVRDADEAVLLPGSDSTAYTDGNAIISIAKDKNADAVIPGYGFLSENGKFARAVKEAGLAWVGPSAEAIEAFGIKHLARELAEKAEVPIVPGTKGLIESEDEAVVKSASGIGFPVMLKATGGGGGMGLVICNNENEVREGFRTATSRGEALFKNPGVFIEKYFPSSRHIEIQVFGNGRGKAIHFGERECSIQRRHQKVIEECPSPFISRYEGLREALGSASAKLAESVNYASAGTVEYLLDEKSGGCFFLEMNTRLQVEHGITEMCYGIDIVEMMLKQADAELSGKGGLDASYLESLQKDHSMPKGSAIEARVYAENPIKDYAPSPGLLQEVEWAYTDSVSTRIDTWVARGSTISPNYDPLIAKVMYHSEHSRADAIDGLQLVLQSSRICGPPTNLDLLTAIAANPDFASGNTLTTFLEAMTFSPPAVDVITAGAYTLIMDYPGRPWVARGIPHSGAMDPVALQIANLLVGNPRGKEGLEITLSGPELRFVRPAVIALCGAQMEASIDGTAMSMWKRIHVKAGQKVKIGKTTGGGCRSYLAVYGGFPNVAEYFGSKSTSPLVSIGGYQGRALAPGDVLGIVEEIPEKLMKAAELSERLIPKYTDEWEIMTMVGPHDVGYLLPEDIEMLYTTEWQISHNTNRSGIRLIGPIPKWARNDGGEGGSHPSNVIEYGYPVGTLNWTGDDPCIFPVDGPNFGGFISSTTVIRAEWTKMGQLRAGDKMRYRRVSFDEAVAARKLVNKFVDNIDEAIQGTGSFDSIEPLNTMSVAKSTTDQEWGHSILHQIEAEGTQPLVTYRQAGDSHLIVEYGKENFDLNHRCRTSSLEKLLYDSNATSKDLTNSLINTVSCCTSITLTFNPLAYDRAKILEHLISLEAKLGDLSSIKVTTRKFRLPISFQSRAQDLATQRYMETQRPHAPYLPDNLKFVAENNAFTPERLKDIFLKGTLAAVVVGFFCGNTVSLPVDPRERMSCPKTNPSRVETPAGTCGWGGSCCSIYPVTSPGGYQMLGRTIPIFDQYGVKPNFEPSRPWLFNAFDLLTFYQVSEDELDSLLEAWDAGKYEFKWEDVEFDMEDHNKLLKDTSAEVKEIRAKQAVVQEEMIRKEKESLAKWREEKAAKQVDPGTVESLLADDSIEPVEATLDANMWKVLVEEGDEVVAGTEICILEAMKLEISVKLPEQEEAKKGKKMKVEKLLVPPGETVKAGGHIALIRSL